MKKVLMPILIFAIALTMGITAFAETPVADPAAEIVQLESEASESEAELPADDPAITEQPDESLEVAEPAKEPFTVFGIKLSNIITTGLVVAVFITGVVTKKMGKW